MRRFFIRHSLAFAVLFLLSTRFVDVTVGSGFGRHPAEIAWEATGLPAERFVLDHWLEGREGGGDLRRAAREIAARLRVREAALFGGEAGGVRFANLDGRLPDGGELVLTIQSAGKRWRVGLSCSYDRLPPDLRGLERKVLASLARFGPPGEWSWTIRGRRAGRVDPRIWRTIWARVLAAVGAVRRDEGRDEWSVAAYTPLLPAPPGTATNLALVLRYDEAARSSVLIMASPIPLEES